MLEGLGLDTTAEAVYRLMLEDHRRGVAELARLSGLDEDAVRQALDRLADLRLLRISDDGPHGGLEAIDPNVSLHGLLRRRQEELLRNQWELERCQAAISTVLAEYSDLHYGGGHPDAERLIGLGAIKSRIAELAATAATECLTFNPGGAQSAASLAASKPLDQAVITRGVAMRTVYLDSMRNDPVTAHYAEWLTTLGGQVRTVPSLPLRMLVVDRSVALVPVDPDNTRRGAVQVSGPGVITALVALFEHIWAAATPCGTVHERDDQGLTRQESELLRLLADGLTDAAACKRLGLSLRTVRRMMADLMERLDARSRFEAGAKADRRGWL
ncbi:helix-turn-helix transcriptional regulator [Yinghuangia seranimata]|uniref:helix-turn-helix transcriptional regulator n=1 Tax=Yinghuangia seranimata TaxID=408067 RepID=UPI00248ABBE6|nr:helix-turn-helix transcriptional regulator [Yinghuangia seranimata]MDI2130088.1 helix-turn-helix transcriptional regulator [Yinghuangia seranimata]